MTEQVAGPMLAGIDVHKTVIEICTIETSKRLKWMPIALFATTNAGADAIDWGEKLLAGFTNSPLKPTIRIVDGDGKWLGDWGGLDDADRT